MEIKEVYTYGYLENKHIHYLELDKFKQSVLNLFEEGVKFKVVFQKIYKKRSNKQNNYYWGCIINEYLEGYKETTGEELHDEFVNLTTGEILKIPLTKIEQTLRAHEQLKTLFNNSETTTKNNTVEQGIYYEYCRGYILFAFNREVSLPNKQGKLAIK